MSGHMATAMASGFSLPWSVIYHVLIHTCEHIDAQRVGCLDGGSPLFESVKCGYNASMHESADNASECDMIVAFIS